MYGNDFGVPAGWYEDPIGLPQKRWWDGQGWTEHVAEARGPVIVQEARTTFADDDLLTRRERRERERQERRDAGFDDDYDLDRDDLDDLIDFDGFDAELNDALATAEPSTELVKGSDGRRHAGQPPRELAATLKELEAPKAGTASLDEPAPLIEPLVQPLVAENAPSAFVEDNSDTVEVPIVHATFADPTYTAPEGEASVDDLAHAVRSAPEPTIVTHANAPVTLTPAEQIPTTNAPRLSYTLAGWAIAAIPAIQLGAALLLVLVFGFGDNLPLMLILWLGPYPLVLGLAAYDRLALSAAGHAKPASAAWAILGAPVYLIVRGARTRASNGRDTALIAVWSIFAVAVAAAVIVFPGIAIAALPSSFSAEAAQSVEADAVALGASVAVACPATPPLVEGGMMTCIATKASGDSEPIVVSLQRLNGWVSWQVEDWGFWNLTE
jgi:Protein of unknown function (DUF2510)